MTYSVGSLIQATDYIGLRGSKAPSVAYADDTEAQNKLAALIGVGYGTRGYGQTSTTFPAVSAGDTITASQWNSLFSVLSSINTHTGSALTVPSSVSAGSTIEAYDGSSGRPNVSTVVTTLDTNRLQADPLQMTLTSKLTSVRSTSWTVQVLHEFTVTFASEDTARYFFNSAGEVRLSASKTTVTSDSLNNAITQLLSNMGTIKFGANATTYTGTGGTPYAIGYYQLTGVYQTLFYQPGPVSYSAPSYTLQGRAESITGTNGGNGSTLRFRAIFDTNVVGYATVDGTLTSAVSELIATGSLTVASPTYTTVTGL